MNKFLCELPHIVQIYSKAFFCIQKLLILVSSHELSWGILYLIFNKVEREREKNEMK